MANKLVRAYERFSNAQHARNALLIAGFSAQRVRLDAYDDEAGPVDGNFILDEMDTGKGPPAGILGILFGTEARTDAYNNDEPLWGASYVMTVEACDDRESAHASDIMASFGAIDVDARVRGSR